VAAVPAPVPTPAVNPPSVENPGAPSTDKAPPPEGAGKPPAAAAPAPSAEAAAAPVAPAADFEHLLTTCQTAFNGGRMKEATTACTAAVEANPESAKAIALLAHSEFNRSHRKDALSWAEKAIKIDPKLADPYVIIGGVQQDSGRNVEAKAAYRRYLELAPKGQYASDLRAILDSL
jgi:tetratricopeptide (TPR) repeat protein